MNRLIAAVALFLMILGCSEENKPEMIVKGKIDGLKKGMLYLQKIEDSTLVTLDSMAVNNDGTYALSAPVASPEVFYLYLDKKDNNEYNDRLRFFGEAGEVTINSQWNAFDTKSEVSGSETHAQWLEYQKVINEFNKRSMELVSLANSPEMKEDTAARDSLARLNEKNLVRGYIYALNYALNNRNSHLAPYIALTEVPDANIKYLDSIYSVLPEDIAGSKYGIALKELIAERKMD